MSPRALTAGSYALTGVSSLASSYYLNYQFFYLRDRFGFDNRANLWVAALHGAVYVFAAWQGGKFAERRGPVASLRAGYAGLVACMCAGLLLRHHAVGILVVLTVYTIVLLLVWPALEALAMADVPPERVPHRVGLYNLTWSSAMAVSYFTGGPLYDWLGAGLIFVLPGLLFLVQLIATTWAGGHTSTTPSRPDVAEVVVARGSVPPELVRTARRPATFLRLAWLANPLAYIAIYTLFAVMPGIAGQLGLSPTRVGLFCSVWLFARLASFVGLWRWTGWHYRFRWLAVGYVLLVGSFTSIVLAPSLGVIVLAQVVFGTTAGLIYYSSLFYAMDLSERRAEHGGLHEAAIGVGICAGPTVGALSLQLFPGVPHAGVFAVTGLLVCGFFGLVSVWGRGAGPRGTRADLNS